MTKPFHLIALLLLLIASSIACKKDDPVMQPARASAPPVATAPATNDPSIRSAPLNPQGRPQGKLPTLKLWVGTNAIVSEIASKANQIPIGMMWRTNMAEMEGMLFVFPYPQQVAFYMRNTLLPLTCAYIDAEGAILEIYDMIPLDETPIPSRSSEIQFVLEMNQGWFQRHGVKPGVVISTDHGTFPQTFRRR